MVISAKDLEVGHEFPSRTKVITQEKISRYGDIEEMINSIGMGKLLLRKRRIQTDPEFARSQGLRGTVVIGMIPTAFISAMMTDIFGEGYNRGGKLKVTFIKPIYADDEITARAVVREKVPEGSNVRIKMDVWCENQDSEKVTVGTASALAR